MPDQTIICPECGAKIPLTEALSNQMRESMRAELEGVIKERERKISEREKKLGERSRELEEDFERRLTLERKKLSDEALKKAREDMALELKDLREEAAHKTRELEQARKAEMELRKRSRDLEDREKNLELTLARKIDAEKERIRRETQEAFTEEHNLRDKEKDQRIDGLKKTIDELKRKVEQGSVQTQGEVLELDLEDLLASRYPMDAIEPVPKGIRGADILHKVRTSSGQHCGTIIWESKRTKHWKEDWISKLKDDQREVGAEVAVLVTEAMPADLATFGMRDGVWVSSIPLAGCLADAVRVGLLQVARTRAASAGKGEKMEAIYAYLSGPEFRQKIEGIVEAFNSMREGLEKEKRAMGRIWAKREKEIDRVVNNTVRMYGDVQGIIGALPEIKALELESGEED